ncbi:hypothetical protein B0H13DRAFT_2306739 [Mycena leptocephala]|nr:hypothetical protein B0H13DRAFT_2306739 [Mycena leptocephala]
MTHDKVGLHSNISNSVNNSSFLQAARVRFSVPDALMHSYTSVHTSAPSRTRPFPPRARHLLCLPPAACPFPIAGVAFVLLIVRSDVNGTQHPRRPFAVLRAAFAASPRSTSILTPPYPLLAPRPHFYHIQPIFRMRALLQPPGNARWSFPLAHADPGLSGIQRWFVGAASNNMGTVLARSRAGIILRTPCFLPGTARAAAGREEHGACPHYADSHSLPPPSPLSSSAPPPPLLILIDHPVLLYCFTGQDTFLLARPHLVARKMENTGRALHAAWAADTVGAAGVDSPPSHVRAWVPFSLPGLVSLGSSRRFLARALSSNPVEPHLDGKYEERLCIGGAYIGALCEERRVWRWWCGSDVASERMLCVGAFPPTDRSFHVSAPSEYSFFHFLFQIWKHEC